MTISVGESSVATRPRRPRTSARRVVVADRLAPWICFLGVAVALLAFGMQSAPLFAIASTLLALSFIAFDMARVREGQISPITLFAIGAAVTGIADTVGLRSINTDARPRYFHYAVDQYLLLSSELALAGMVLTVLGFWSVTRRPEWQSLATLLPKVRGHVTDRALVRGGAAVSVLAIILHTVVPLPPLGTLTGIIFLLPHLITFAMARVGAQHGNRTAQWTALGIATLEALRALWFSYLRAEIVFPLGAFAFGILLGSRSLRPFRSGLFVPLYVFLVPFVLYFGAFAEVRSGAGGVERIVNVYELEQGPVRVQSRPKQTLLSRVTTFNQLSQIGYLVERDGYRNGSTLDYLAFAFIPRFLWREKPLIAKGAWFALEIGQGYVQADGSISNSVAMTIPGELYLNFGWFGVLVGCFVFGSLLALFWTCTDFWRDPDNVLGSAFGFHLLWTGFGLGADLQLLVTTTAVYLLFVAASVGLGMLGGGSRAGARRLQTASR